MDETISSADANREFSRLLRGVREGNSYIVTSHGRPVARITPIAESTSTREKAKQDLLDRLRNQPLTNAGRWTREELYDD